MPRPDPPTNLHECEIKPAANSPRFYLYHRASGWISRPMSRREAEHYQLLSRREAKRKEALAR